MNYLLECPKCKNISAENNTHFKIEEQPYGTSYTCICGTILSEDEIVRLKVFEGDKYNIPYSNYHLHRDDSNVFTGADSNIKAKDYAKRVLELNHNTISSCCHGYQGKYHEVFEHRLYSICNICGKKYLGHQKCKCGSEDYDKKELKFVYAVEIYWVEDLGKNPKDRSNAHMIVMARNENGRKQINKMLSEVHEKDYIYYGRPRCDLSMIERYLNPNDVICTTACIAFWKYDDMEAIIQRLHYHFGDSLYLEYQTHISYEQIELNKYIQELSNMTGIKTVIGMDSHYIYPHQHIERDEYIKQKRKGKAYDDDLEDSWYMDYPTSEMVFSRMDAQGVLSEDEVREALLNTNIVLSFDDIVFKKDRKVAIAKRYKDTPNSKRKKILSKIINNKFKEHMSSLKRAGILDEYLLEKYKAAIRNEMKVILDGDSHDYFLANYHIMRGGEEKYGGTITPTGRGCFTEEALVHTSDTIKSIKHISAGDYVITKDGKYNMVTKTMVYDIEEDLIQIDHLYDSRDIYPAKCTTDHKILINRDGITQWVTAENVNNTDYVCLPKIKSSGLNISQIDLLPYAPADCKYNEEFIWEPRYNNGGHESRYSISNVAKELNISESSVRFYSEGTKFVSRNIIEKIHSYIPFKNRLEYKEYLDTYRTRRISRYVKCDHLFLKLVGLMYGDGCIPYGSKTAISLAVNSTTVKDMSNRSIFEEFFKKLGLDVTENKAKNRNLTQLYCRSNTLRAMFKDFMFESKKNTEKEFKSFWLNSNSEESTHIIWGLLQSDGHFSKDGRISFDNTSRSIINAYKILNLIAGNYPTSMQTRSFGIDSRGYARKESFKLRRSKDPLNSYKRKDRILEDDKYWFLPVHNVKRIKNVKTKVYDISVQNEHNYLLNNMIVHNSGVAFYTNFLLQLTKLDRIRHPLTMYPERFLSAGRLAAGQFPDIDMNLSDQEPFIKAQEDEMGEGHQYWMISYGTLKEKSAWKMYAGASGVDPTIANEISSSISRYDDACKYGMIEDDEGNEILDPSIRIEDYIPEKYMGIYEKSKRYIGILSDVKPSPCSFLLYTDGDIREEVGIIRLKGKDGKEDKLVACIEGSVADSYGYLKNDLLKVVVVDIIGRFYKRIGIPIPDAMELYDQVKNDKEVWNIYRNGYTMGINQFEKRPTAEKMMKYAPKNPVEIFCAVAAVRPGFRTLIDKFINRESHEYGLRAFDDLIQTPEMPYSYLLFQENLMKALVFTGITAEHSVDVVKAISKKKIDKIRKEKDAFINGFYNVALIEFNDKEKAMNMANELWGVFEDASRYSFNAPHSASVGTDSLYGAWGKANYPIYFYETMLRIFSEKKEKEKCSLIKQEMWEYKRIELTPVEWGYDNTDINAMPKENKITDSMLTISRISKEMSVVLYDLYKKLDDNCNFLDILKELYSLERKPPQLSTKMKVLIKLQYFRKFSEDAKLLKVYNIFLNYKDKNSIRRDSDDKIERFAYKYCSDLYKKDKDPESIKLKNSNPRTKKKWEVEFKKMGEGFDLWSFMNDIFPKISNVGFTEYQRVLFDLAYKKFTLREMPPGIVIFHIEKITKSGKYAQITNLTNGKHEFVSFEDWQDGEIEGKFILVHDGFDKFISWKGGNYFHIISFDRIILETERIKKETGE